MQRNEPPMAPTSRHPLDTDLLDLIQGTLSNTKEELLLAHLALCLLCRIKRQRLGGVPPIEFGDVREFDTPTFQPLEVRDAPGTEARRGELWLTGGDEGCMVLIRTVRTAGLVVVPVTMDVEVADDETLVLDATVSPLELPLAIYERLTISIPFAAIVRRVVPVLAGVDLTALSTDTAGVTRGSAIDGPSDPRLEVRQYLIDRLSALKYEQLDEPVADDSPFGPATIDRLFSDLQEYLAEARGDEVSVERRPSIGPHMPEGWIGIALVEELKVRVVVVQSPSKISDADEMRAAERVLERLGASSIVFCTPSTSDAELYENAGLHGSRSPATGEWTRGPLLERISMPDAVATFLDRRLVVLDRQIQMPVRGEAVDVQAVLDVKVGEAVARVLSTGSKATTPEKKIGFAAVASSLDGLRDLLRSAFDDTFSVQSLIDLADRTDR